ncbi:glycosyltransferase [Flavobacterium coralii]|jgi:glycosyltransferase involved in cell wall biosynthesis|uniref:glycosyltransferase family 4 protein n=1 Tax=Flavobacterium coralii TaxID=2838017 RepID=UPI000C362F49|nr:glycosyl transferase [Flavobacterium sp.]|tara:strand:+ start:33268 stop:34437 length:1170 start_codon:yes stop_codon:yes gene_type:complete
MRKVLFVHDGPMLCNLDKTVFYGVHYKDEIVERYSFFGDVVSFLMRYKTIPDSEGEKYSRISHPAFNAIEVPDYKSIQSRFKKGEAEKIIEKAVAEHDIILLRLPSANGVIAQKYARKYNKPVFVEVVACVFDALWNYDWRGKFIAHYKMWKYRQHIKDSEHVLYVTKDFLQGRYPTKGKSIGCSDVILKHFDDSILEKRLLKQNLEEPVITLGTVAAIDVPYKGQADVIKALYLLKQKGKTNYIYKIVGQGKPDFLQKLIDKYELNDQVEILGSLPHDKVFDFLDSLSLYIQPSKQEGLPRSVIEAISRACPVLATNIAGNPELVDPDALYKAGDIKKLVSLLSDYDNLPLEKWATNNFERAHNFTAEKLTSQRLNFYTEFLKDNNIE